MKVETRGKAEKKESPEFSDSQAADELGLG